MSLRDAVADATDRAIARYGGGGSDDLPLSLTLLSGALVAALLSPLAWLLLRTLEVETATAVELLTGASTASVATNSVALVVVVTAASVLLGVPLAVLTVRTDLPFVRFWTVVLALPLVVPSYIGAFAYVDAFGPNGLLADALAPLGVESLPSIYGFEGAALVLTLYVYPYVFLTTRAALLSFDATLVEAARTLDRSRREAFRRVTLPQIAPGIAAGALLVALYALSDFGTPAIMHVDVFTRMIYVQYNAGAVDAAALLSVQLLGVTAVVLAVESQIGEAERAYVGRGAEGRTVPLGRWTLPALLLCGAVVALALLVPLGVLGLWLVREPLATGGMAFSWTYAWNSVTVSAVAAAVAVLVALPVAYLSARSDSRLAALFDRATYVGYAVPGIVLGLALVSLGVRVVPALYQTLPLLIFAYVVRFVPQAVGTTRSSIIQVDRRLLEVARTLGESPVGTFRRVTLPLIAPGVAAGAALVFLTTMRELPATLLLQPLNFETLVSYIWLVRGAGYYGLAAVPALILVGVSGLSMLVILARERHDDR